MAIEMIDLDVLTDDLKAVLRWQLANPGATDGPQVPWSGKRLWSIFLDLNAARGSNGWGPNPISFREIEAWAWLNREPVRPWELQILRAMDAAYLDNASQRASKGQQSASQPHSSAAIGPALFDAVFQ